MSISFPASSYSLKFSRRFLRSLIQIKRREYYFNNNNNNNMCCSRRVSKKIKLAAYASMARAVGPRKAWARALLRRKRHSVAAKKKRENDRELERLREIVPGGKEMEVCSLFEETAHFIHSLSLQLHLMQLLLNRLSN